MKMSEVASDLDRDKEKSLPSTTKNSTKIDVTKPTPKNRKRKRKLESFISKLGGIYVMQEIKGVTVPFIFRGSVEKYAEKCMLEKTLVAKYYPLFGDDVFDCIKLKAVRVHPSELNLLNEINIVHGKCEFLDRPYSNNEVLIDIKQVKELATFLDVCYNMLVIMRDDIEECGYLRIDDSETLIPFVNVNEEKLIPLFYFEGSHLNLDNCIINLTDQWPLAYIKILCKMQNVKRSLYNLATSLEVVAFPNLMKMIRSGASVETCWPDSFECNLLRKIPSQKLTNIKLHKEFQLQVTVVEETKTEEEEDEDEANIKKRGTTEVFAVEEFSDSDDNCEIVQNNTVNISGETRNKAKKSNCYTRDNMNSY